MTRVVLPDSRQYTSLVGASFSHFADRSQERVSSASPVRVIQADLLIQKFKK